MFEGARRFGLTDREVLRSLELSMLLVDDETTVGELVDELAGTLAQSIVFKERRSSGEAGLSPAPPADS